MSKKKAAKHRKASLYIILSTMERGFASVAADIEATDEKIDGVCGDRRWHSACDLTVTGLAKALPYSWAEQEQSIGVPQ